MRLLKAVVGLSVASLVSVVAGESPIPPTFENLNVVQSLDLTGSYLKRSLEITAKNIADESQSDYFLAVDLDQVPNLAIIEAQDKQSGRSVPVERIPEVDSEHGITYYKVHLRQPLEPDAEINILVAEAYTGLLKPLPEYGSQKDSQYLVYTGSKHVTSPYNTLKAATKIKTLGNYAEELREDSEDKTSDIASVGDNNVLSFGDYHDLPPFSFKRLSLRYENPRPMIKADKLIRELWVSHWGNSISFEESYWLTNIGTRLKETFSRLDYSRGLTQYNLNVASLKEIIFPLAKNARDAYFTDLVGNVSTSHFRSNDRESVLEARPRYPVFGGWHYNFTIGWSHDLSDYVRDVGNDRFILKVPIIQGPHDISYEEVYVNVILPEGASDIQVISLFGTELQLSTKYSFLDTKGRPTVELEYSNLIDGHRSGEFFVQYTYTQADALRKPIAISLTLASFFTLFLFLSKVDISIFSKH